MTWLMPIHKVTRAPGSLHDILSPSLRLSPKHACIWRIRPEAEDANSDITSAVIVTAKRRRNDEHIELDGRVLAGKVTRSHPKN